LGKTREKKFIRLLFFTKVNSKRREKQKDFLFTFFFCITRSQIIGSGRSMKETQKWGGERKNGFWDDQTRANNQG